MKGRAECSTVSLFGSNFPDMRLAHHKLYPVSDGKECNHLQK